ncbi:MAG: DegT/DnrJ/EryC1/StrS family aminotransferase, partial [Cytophagales bacterium]
MIQVTKPFLPPENEYLEYIQGIWQRNWLTNNGPLVNELELQLKRKLGLKHLLFLGNGTVALQIALKALEIKGEVITTPFSYVATTSCIVWENLKPVFVDIEPETFNIDPKKIESKITKHTSAILATHCFGNACDINAIEKIAVKHNLKVIYDGAHCFGTNFNGKSIFEFGDISTCSFHATKLFHTIEGGCVVTKDAALTKKMAHQRNFGHNGPERGWR